jgi:hypothetical protein
MKIGLEVEPTNTLIDAWALLCIGKMGSVGIPIMDNV